MYKTIPALRHLRALQTDMVTYLPYPTPLRESVEGMMNRWREFCALPEDIKMLFGYTQDLLISGAGYELKKQGARDQKENFHFRRDKQDFLYFQARRVGVTEAFNLLTATRAVYETLDPLIHEFVRRVEEEYDIPGYARDVSFSEATRIIRLLHYFGGKKPGDMLGDPHPDKGGFTGHLYESDPGVERLTIDGTWVPMDVENGEAAFFSGLGLQNRSRGQILAPWHRIVANEQTAVQGRWSAVCFSSAANNRYYDKGRMGSTQGLPFGATYRMSFPEFDQLFMD